MTRCFFPYLKPTRYLNYSFYLISWKGKKDMTLKLFQPIYYKIRSICFTVLLQIRYFEGGLLWRFKKFNFLFLSNRMSSVCHWHVLVCHSYGTRMYSYVIRMSIVFFFLKMFSSYIKPSFYCKQQFSTLNHVTPLLWKIEVERSRTMLRYHRDGSTGTSMRLTYLRRPYEVSLIRK